MDQFISENKRQEYFAFHDKLRESGAKNMYGAAAYLMEAFPRLRFDNSLAAQVLCDWMPVGRSDT